MKKFKVGQTVYYYLDYGDYTGAIIACNITKATKDLSTGKITYKVSTMDEYKTQWYFTCLSERELTDEYLYADKRQIEKEYKDEIAYNKLYKAITNLEKTFIELKTKLEPKPEYDLSSLTLSINEAGQCYNKLYVSAEDIVVDNTSLKEELTKLKKKVSAIEKKIKPKTKKKVVIEKPKEESK